MGINDSWFVVRKSGKDAPPIKHLMVLPVINPEIGNRCIESAVAPNSCLGIDPSNVIVVDNTRDGVLDKNGPFGYYRDPNNHNLGVARAWNIGAKKVVDEGYDYLTLCSASIVFGPEYQCTWDDQVRWSGTHVVESMGHSWHLIAFHRSTFEAVGFFDGNFYPAYFEAIDFGYRMKLAGLEEGWPRAWVNVMSTGVAQHNEIVSTPAPPLLEYYRGKWGGDKGEEVYTLPWDNMPIDYCPNDPIPDLAKRYKLQVWW